LARQAASRYPDLPGVLGRCIQSSGNHVHVIRHDIVAFPTKHNWWEKSDLGLIAQSARELLPLARQQQWKLVALPRVGTGNGQLRWSAVKPILTEILGDSPVFVIVDNA
jgi:O-acetyl-ADP-ribose deacetylase (regulator of RNase III)